MSANETIRTPRVSVYRAPNGVPKQVMTHMTPQEREKLEEIAELEMRSISSTLRILMLRGMQAYEDDTLAAE